MLVCSIYCIIYYIILLSSDAIGELLLIVKIPQKNPVFCLCSFSSLKNVLYTYMYVYMYTYVYTIHRTQYIIQMGTLLQHDEI